MRARFVTAALAFTLACLTPGCGSGGRPARAPDPTSNEVVQFHEAVKDGDVEIVRRLLAAKPYLANARNEQGVSPLQSARQAGNDELADVIREKGGRE
jgi:hypothetical protein